jgi:hypothetical protein
MRPGGFDRDLCRAAHRIAVADEFALVHGALNAYGMAFDYPARGT